MAAEKYMAENGSEVFFIWMGGVGCARTVRLFGGLVGLHACVWACVHVLLRWIEVQNWMSNYYSPVHDFQVRLRVRVRPGCVALRSI